MVTEHLKYGWSKLSVKHTPDFDDKKKGVKYLTNFLY